MQVQSSDNETTSEAARTRHPRQKQSKEQSNQEAENPIRTTRAERSGAGLTKKCVSCKLQAEKRQPLRLQGLDTTKHETSEEQNNKKQKSPQGRYELSEVEPIM